MCLLYRFYGEKLTNFETLFLALNAVGVQVGSPNDDTKPSVLKYSTSSAYRHELLENWGGNTNPTYHIVPKIIGGGPHQKMKKTHKLAILQSKCTNASAKAS